MSFENPENLNDLNDLNNADEDVEKKERGPKEEEGSFGEDPNEKEDIPLYDKEDWDED